ncbi:MAG: cell division protein CrgA [Nocardioides sp.]
MSKPKATNPTIDPSSAGRALSPRFVVALVLFVVGLAWVAYYYLSVRVAPGSGDAAGGPAFLANLKRWNYGIGFGLALLGLVISAHPSTPMGRGRGVVIGMLGCFLVGLVWICTYYVFANDLSPIPVFNDLGQLNLVVGIGLMAVGFTFATRWE